MRTPILASTAVRCAAVMINPEFRYTPEPTCCPLRIIAAGTIQGPPLSFRSAPLEIIGAKSAPARQRANAKRTLSSPRRKQDHLGHLSAPRAQGNAVEVSVISFNGRLESAPETALSYDWRIRLCAAPMSASRGRCPSYSAPPLIEEMTQSTPPVRPLRRSQVRAKGSTLRHAPARSCIQYTV